MHYVAEQSGDSERVSLQDAYSIYFNNCIAIGIDALSYQEWLDELDSLGS